MPSKSALELGIRCSSSWATIRRCPRSEPSGRPDTVEVFANLVHNATKYAPQGTRITVRIERADDRAIVRVQDQGQNTEKSVTVKVAISGVGKPISVEQQIATINQGETQTASVPLPP